MTTVANDARQAGLTALYLGVFATVWFSVPKADPPLSTLLVVASIAALLTAVAGLGLVLRSRGAGRAPRDPAADRRYLLIFAGELAVAAAGAAQLAALDQEAYIPALVGAVVGVHFVPLAPVLRDPLLRPLGAVVVVIAVAAALTEAATTTVSAGQVAGTGIGFALLGYAVMALSRGARRR